MNLDPASLSEGPRLASAIQIRFTYCWSAALIPKPADWPSYKGRETCHGETQLKPQAQHHHYEGKSSTYDCVLAS